MPPSPKTPNPKPKSPETQNPKPNLKPNHQSPPGRRADFDRRKSQIQTYLEQNEGEGVQHMALLTEGIFATIRSIRSMARFGGFELMGR